MMAIKILLGIFLLIPAAFSCETIPGVKIYSLSSPVTMLLEEIKALDSKQVKAISVFHPVKSFDGERLAGGVFLTEKPFDDIETSIIFFDESKDFRRNLSRLKKAKKIEVVSRDMGAFSAYELSKKILKPYLRRCDKELIELDLKVNHIKASLLNSKKNKLVFYLNHIKKNGKKPNLVIINDGFVKSLIKYAKTKTYPSSLGYVNWSSKIMEKLNKDYLHIGVEDSKSDIFKFEKVTDKLFNLSFRGALSPGIRQIFLLEKIKEKVI